jgi:hypothetical protein
MNEAPWLDDSWEPSSEWTLQDRIELTSALLELIQRDVYAGRYSAAGRPNFTSVQLVLRESASVLESARDSAREMLKLARKERNQ